MSTQNPQELLEALVDRHSVVGVLALLAQVCSDKATHVRTTWQDEALAATWDKRMMFLDNLVAKLTGGVL